MMTKIIKIKSETLKDFEKAELEGYIYGYYNGQKNICVYVELGKKGTYQRKSKDDPKTDYKIFYNCNVYFAPTLEMLEAGVEEQLGKILNQTVVIYY